MALLMDQSRSVLPLRSAKAREFGELWREKCTRAPWTFPFKLVRTSSFRPARPGKLDGLLNIYPYYPAIRGGPFDFLGRGGGRIGLFENFTGQCFLCRKFFSQISPPEKSNGPPLSVNHHQGFLHVCKL